MRSLVVAAAALVFGLLLPQDAQAVKVRLVDRSLVASMAPGVPTAAVPTPGYDLGGGSGVSASGVVAQTCAALATESLGAVVLEVVALGVATSFFQAGGGNETSSIAFAATYVAGLLFLLPLASSAVVYALARVDGIDASFGRIYGYSVVARLLGAAIIVVGVVAKNLPAMMLGSLVFGIGGVVAEIVAANSDAGFLGSAAPDASDAPRRWVDARDVGVPAASSGGVQVGLPLAAWRF